MCLVAEVFVSGELFECVVECHEEVFLDLWSWHPSYDVMREDFSGVEVDSAEISELHFVLWYLEYVSGDMFSCMW